jgi:hypothetical protein
VAGELRPDSTSSLDLESALAANYDRLSLGKRRVIDRLLNDTRYAVIVSAPELAREVGVSGRRSRGRRRHSGSRAIPIYSRSCASASLARRPCRRIVRRRQARRGAELARLRVMHGCRVRPAPKNWRGDAGAAVDALLSARRVYVFGARGSHGLAVMLGIGLRLLLPDTGCNT